MRGRRSDAGRPEKFYTSLLRAQPHRSLFPAPGEKRNCLQKINYLQRAFLDRHHRLLFIDRLEDSEEGSGYRWAISALIDRIRKCDDNP